MQSVMNLIVMLADVSCLLDTTIAITHRCRAESSLLCCDAQPGQVTGSTDVMLSLL